ncbi:hypothetical protein AAC387_Pa02g3747 [Persea americana]
MDAAMAEKAPMEYDLCYVCGSPWRALSLKCFHGHFLCRGHWFHKVSTTMKDLCFDVFGTAKEKKDPRAVKGNRELLDELPGKRKHEEASDYTDDSSLDDEDGLEVIMVFIDILSFPYATYLFSV